MYANSCSPQLQLNIFLYCSCRDWSGREDFRLVTTGNMCSKKLLLFFQFFCNGESWEPSRGKDRPRCLRLSVWASHRCRDDIVLRLASQWMGLDSDCCFFLQCFLLRHLVAFNSTARNPVLLGFSLATSVRLGVLSPIIGSWVFASLYIA